MKRRVGDRRSKPRFEIVGDLWGHIDITSSIFVRNVSRDGALLECPLPLEQDSIHWITVLVEEQPHLVQLRVRHSRAEPGGDVSGDAEPRFLIGVEFLKLTPAVREALRRSAERADNSVSAEV